jgi:spermidine/putrescine transport system substrate-binding protein
MKLRLLMTLLWTLSFIACAPKGEVLYLFNWAYYIPDDVLDDFRRETGIKVVLDTYDSNETLYAKLRSGNAKYDIVVPSADYMELMRDQGMLAAIDKSLLPNLAYLDEDVRAMLTFDAEQHFSVPYFIGSAGINVNKRHAPDLPSTWGIFGLEQYKGRMTMMNDMRETLGAALAYNGFSINSTNAAEIEIAKQTVLGWKRNLLKFDAEMFGKDFASGTTYIAHGYAEVVLTELEEVDGVEYEYILPDEGGVIYVDNLVILADSSNSENAHTFINYLLRPDVHARIADTFYYPTLMQAAKELRSKSPAYELSDLIAKGYEVKRDVGADSNMYVQAWAEILRN